MKKLKVGLVGIGRGTAYGHIFSNHERTEVVALCDRDEEKLAQSAADFALSDQQIFTNYEDFLNADIDIVVLGTPIPFHADEVCKALAMNKHVLSEVTAADSIAACERIVQAARRSKGKYMMAENCIYMEFCAEWKRHIDAGRIGTPFYAEADYVHEIRDRVQNQWRAQRAPLHYCSHSLGPVLYWMDDYIVRATASGSRSTMIEPATPGNIDIQVALFETKKGATIKVLRSSVALRRPALCSYGIYGTKGFLESSRVGYDGTGRRYFEGIDPVATGRDITSSTINLDAPQELLLSDHGTSEYYLVQDFLRAIEADEQPPIDIVRAMDMTVPGLVAHDAAMKGGVWMDVPRITD